MTDTEIRAHLRNYQLQIAHDEGPKGQELAFAWYTEIPGCLAEGINRDAALAELDAVIIPFIEGILADGGSMPVPRSMRPRRTTTQIQKVNQVVLGNVREMKLASTSEKNSVSVTPTQFNRVENGQIVQLT